MLWHASLSDRLESYQAAGLTRALPQARGVDFASNDYLGFAQDPLLRQDFLARLSALPCGATGPRLLTGNLPIYEETESQLAAFVGREAALLFPSGYQANVGLYSALLRPCDYVFSDARNHASTIDGIRLSGAHKIIFPHRDYDFLETQLAAHAALPGIKLISSESLFSMTGTLADLPTLAALAATYGALLVIDEAHSMGVWGASLVAQLGLCDQVFATVHPAGKALGASGAWVAGGVALKTYLLHFARAFLFSTAPIPAVPALLQAAMSHYERVGRARAVRLRKVARIFREYLALAVDESAKESPIIPVFVGENTAASALSAALREKGWAVSAIRPPTVPEGQAQLRLTVKWDTPLPCLSRFASELATCRRACYG